MGRSRLDSLVFVSSEFLRARQTAEECRAALENIISFENQAMVAVSSSSSSGGGGGEGDGETPADGAETQEKFSLDEGAVGGYDVSPPIVVRKELRERWFGELEGTILVNYNKVRFCGALLRSAFAECMCAGGDD